MKGARARLTPKFLDRPITPWLRNLLYLILESANDNTISDVESIEKLSTIINSTPTMFAPKQNLLPLAKNDPD